MGVLLPPDLSSSLNSKVQTCSQCWSLIWGVARGWGQGTAKCHLDISKAKSFLFNLIIVECSQFVVYFFYLFGVFANHSCWKQWHLGAINSVSGRDTCTSLFFWKKSTSFPCGHSTPTLSASGNGLAEKCLGVECMALSFNSRKGSLACLHPGRQSIHLC